MTTHPTRPWRLGSVLLALQAAGAAAHAAADADAAAAAAAPQDPQRPRLETIVVTAHPLSAEGLALASEVLDGQELSRKLQSSIGATVGLEPGVHASTFGQASSRPVVHGLSGPRVRVMEDRIDSLDVSATSADHAITIEPFLAQSIEILKGPSTLIYGSGAIGGVVDVHTGRIPHQAPDAPIAGRAEFQHNDNGDQSTGALRLDGGLGAGSGIAWHLDAFSRDADPYEIPGHAESAALRALEGAETDADPDAGHDDAEGDGELPGSELETHGGAIGLSWTGERGFVGAAVSILDARYGLPGGHGHEHDEAPGGAEQEEEPEGNPVLDLEQVRIDFEAALQNPLSGFSSLNLRLGRNDYEHREIEPSGATATEFENDAWEARAELVHEAVAGWEGAFGIQYVDRDFSAIGEEAFIAPVRTRSIGAFWVGERGFDRFDLEAGFRLEDVDLDPEDASADSFTALAASLGIVVPLGEAWSLGVLGDYSRRAPVAEELYSDGPHLATGSFEIGNPELDEEQAWNVAATAKYAADRWYFAATAYYTRFDDYIFQAGTGAEEDGLPVLIYGQADATFKGLDTELRATALRWDGGQLDVRFMFDTVSAELDVSGNDNLPRIPADRIGTGIDLTWGPFNASVDYLRVRDQNDTAEFELPTDGYDDLRMYLGVHLGAGRTDLEVFVQGSNLTDDEQRNHTSFIKDYVPLPGRTVAGGLRLRF